MRNVIKWVGLPFRVVFFAAAFVGLLVPFIALVGLFSWDDASDMWRDVLSLGRQAITYGPTKK